MGEVQLDLDDAVPGAHGVDRHPDLHAEAGSERAARPPARARATPAARRSAPLLAGRTAGGSPSARSRPPAQPAPDTRSERRHRQVGLRRAAPPRRARPARRRLTEITVAEDEDRLRAIRRRPWPPARARRASRAARVTAAPLPITRSLRTTRAPASRASSGGGVGRAVVGDPDRRAGESSGERVQRGPDRVGLVVGGDDDEDVRGHGSIGDRRLLSPTVTGSTAWRIATWLR